MNSNQMLSVGLCFLFCWIAGCAKSVQPGVEIQGSVFLDGEPVAEAQVLLSQPKSSTADRGHVGTFSAQVVDGEFHIPSRGGPPPGKYEVIVKPIEPDSEEAFEQLRQRQPVLLRDRNLFLQAVQRKGPIQVDLSSGELNMVTVELTSR